jgi:branched-subunit amino acid transport protein
MRLSVVLLIAGMGVVTYLTRAPGLLAFTQRALPARVERGLRHLPVALLVALIVPTLLRPSGPLAGPPSPPVLLGAVVTLLTLRRTSHVGLGVAAGVVTVALVRWVGAP